jgi:DNA-binding response OmpR family regulator
MYSEPIDGHANMCRILIADDDRAMLAMIEQVLDQEGYTVYTARSVHEVMEIVEITTPDLFLIDLVLPEMNGLALCRKLRNNPLTAEAPIIFLTGQHDAHSAAEALEAGGDDYVRKPFAVRELTARIRAHLRRVKTQTSSSFSSLRILPNTYQVYVDTREVMLTRIEFDLLTYLCNSPKKWHGTQDLLTNVWSYPEGVGDTALVRNHIRNLRRKLEADPDHPAIIQSRHGRGYSIRADIRFS